MSEIWTETPPTEACYLWMRGPGGEYVCHYRPGDEVQQGWEYGPRIPTAAELHRAAECQTELVAKCAAAESRVRMLETREAALRLALRVGPCQEPCRCGVEPYTDGEMCPLCHSVYVLEKLPVT